MNTTCSVKAVCGDAQFPPEVLKLLIESCREPLVIKGQLGSWMNSRSWKIEDICRALGSKSTTFKVFPRRGTEIYRDFSVAKNKVPDETDCVFVSGAFEDFNRWWIANSSESQVLSQCYSSGSREKTSTSDILVSSSSSVSGISSSSTDSKAESSSTSAEKSTGDELSRMPSTSATFLSLSFSTPQQPCSTSLLDFPARNFWVYADYNYLSKLCTEAPELLAAVDWSIFGFDQQTGQDSALWLGSVGAFTPCHQDTYGFNIVAQLSGEKTWTLYSPEDTQYMYPTRIPFEESSVFSEVDVVEPDYRKHPLHKLAKPYRVVLVEGDVLVVPRHWWHYVECTGSQPSVSVNTWVNLPSDSLDRLKEAVVRTLISAFVDMEDTGGRDYLNPNEELFSNDVNLSLVGVALKEHGGILKGKELSKAKEKATEEDEGPEAFLKAVTSGPVVDAIVKALGVEEI